MKRLIVAALSLIATAASAQQQTPPYCTGQNFALQFSQAGWVCAAIAGVIGPQGPQGPVGLQGEPGPQGQKGDKGDPLPPSPSNDQCITAKWDGTQWVCVPTTYLNAQ